MVKKGSTKEKVLLLLLGGLTLGLQRSPKGYFKVLKAINSDWKRINKQQLLTSIRSLYKSKLVDQIPNKDGTVTFVLNRNGKEIAIRLDFENMEINKHRWDGIWRIVMFDIPEKKKSTRDALRYQLKRLGFIELQHSVFVLPYKCQDEIEYIIEYYQARKFVRYVEANKIDNELDLKHRFGLK